MTNPFTTFFSRFIVSNVIFSTNIANTAETLLI